MEVGVWDGNNKLTVSLTLFLLSKSLTYFLKFLLSKWYIKFLPKVSPSTFAHMAHSLAGLANGRLVALLEGGYFLPSLAGGAFHPMGWCGGGFCGSLIKKSRDPRGYVPIILLIVTFLASFLPWEKF